MTFTKEQLIAKAREQIEFCRHTKITGEGRTHVNQCSALFEIALVALTAEPVYFVEIEGDQDINAGRITGKKRPDLGLLPDGINPLYAVPPAPVVPDIGEIRVGRLPTMNQDDYPGMGDWWVQLRIGEDSDEILARVYGATPQEANSRAEALACRAAMLQGKAEPVSQPYTLPDDKQRLDWLDAQNKRLNEYYGTAYGWKFDANFQRNAMMLNDSNYPVMNVRQAIDEAMRTATRLQEAQEVKK